MADAGSSVDVAKAIGDPLATLVGWLAGLIPEGPARTLLYVVVGLCVAIAPIIYKYCLAVLAQGAAPEGSLERQDYDKLRASLAGGNLAARLYAKWLTAFLGAVERFFGDAGMAGRTVFPRAFGLKTPAPLWTAPAFDRCLFLALIYPIATIFVIWAVSGHVGPAEAALALRADLPGWSRSLLAATIGFSSFALWRYLRTEGWKSFVWGAVAFAGAAIVAFAVAFAGAVIVAAAVPVAVLVPAPIAGAGAVIVAAAVAVLSKSAIKHRRQGIFFSLFLPAMILACLAAANSLSLLTYGQSIGPLLLFLGLLTLLNAPFDWASLGLTRALLRRGLELGGWWLYLLALVDAALAAVIIAALALVMVQAFDELAVHGGGKPVLPLDALFDGIAKNPAAPEYWWAYALLLSSVIPSIINLAIGGMALSRGVPGLGRLLLRWIPEGKAVPEYKRQPAAIGLTVQMFAGAGLGIAAQALLAWGLIFHLMPWIGLDLLDMARAVAAFELPARVAQLFIGLR